MTDIETANNALVQKFGRDVVIYTPVGTSMNIYGDESFSWDGGTTVRAIITEPNQFDMAWKNEGGVITGRNFYLIKADTTINIGDKLVDDSDTYIVDEIRNYGFYNKSALTRVGAYKEIT
jgi:hypothetical protein